MGTPEFAVPALEAISKSYEILEVYTQPPKKKNRGQKILNSPVHLCADKLKIKVRCPISLKTDREINHIRNLKPDVVVVVAYGKILPPSLLKLENIHFLNIHASLLPRWRGAAPIQRAIMNMDKETGISIMRINEKLDAGPTILKSEIRLTNESNYHDVSVQLSKLGAELILDAIDLIKSNKVKFIDQNDNDATYAKKIEKSETKINWNEEAKKIIAKINAFSPTPGCWFSFLGTRIKVLKAKEINISGKPGETLDKKLTIACSKNAVQILKLKKEGKKQISTEEFLRGTNITVGQMLD
jgi:methionyl-tRNA formyltransferase